MKVIYKSKERQRGVALVITLILLAVITFMAIAFLVLSRGQRLSVAGSTDQALARLAADSAQERAAAELVSRMLATTNEFNYDLLVSTNFINPNGFTNGVTIYNPLNVAYTYGNGQPLSLNDSLRNLGNLLYNPRVPVFIVTNAATGSNEFRFYYDANRNGQFDPTGLLGVTNLVGGRPQAVIDPVTRLPATNSFTGDPQWIGALQFPDQPHSADNPFMMRYAYLVLPAGKTLDLNYIHNQARNPSKAGFDQFGRDFNRNQGVGTWEINLAGFLYDLNTNLVNTSGTPNGWGGLYTYDPFRALVNGNAFADAGSLLEYRYNRTLATLATALPYTNFLSDGFDTYSASVPFVTTVPGAPDPDQSPTRLTRFPWAGSDNTNHFFTPQDLFDPTKNSVSFATRLSAAGTNGDSYGRYTFYRLLSQLGTDSAPPKGLNLNFDNLNPSGVMNIASPTNQAAWQPITFFTNAADRLLADAGFTFSSHNIQIYPTNFYSASVHRLLQLAANIYDSTIVTNQAVPTITGMAGFPSVFRPLFLVTKTNGLQVWINKWEDIPNHDLFVNNPPPIMELSETNKIASLNRPDYLGLFYGIPLVIGAKKGFPNFNDLEMQTAVTVTRKLQFLKGSPTDLRPSQINQMYTLSISNSFGVEAWNSYTNWYPRGLRMIVANDMTAWMLKTNGLPVFTNTPYSSGQFSNYVALGAISNIQATSWLGFDERHSDAVNRRSFITPFIPSLNSFWFLPPSTYNLRPGQEALVFPVRNNFDPLAGSAAGFPVPQWALKLRTRLRFILYDDTAKRIVDYVNLASDDLPIDLNLALASDVVPAPVPGISYPYRPDCSPGAMWLTNRLTSSPTPPFGIPSLTGAPYGILNQIAASLGTNDNNVQWTPAYAVSPPGGDRIGAQNFFRTNLLRWGPISAAFSGPLSILTNEFYAPYAPSRTLYFNTSWQANDPLVHYTVGDLTPLVRTNRFVLDNPDVTVLPNIGAVNARYEPWGSRYGSSTDPNLYNLEVKDPLVRRSDDWDFPTNKFANVGWLGRVHRGTPWQTVYLKAMNSPTVDFTNWMKWSGNGRFLLNLGQINTNLLGFGRIALDAVFTYPTNDWRLPDLFTTAFNDNAGRGRLSVNQTNLAAWSAVLSGVVVLTNVSGSAVSSPVYQPLVIPPAGAYDPSLAAINTWPALAKIVSAINNTRTNVTLFPNRAFEHTGDILAVPELSVRSPFLNVGNANLVQNSLNDEAYERIPRQILGLLSCDHEPRFVIYAFGQALKPAPHSIVTSGSYIGLCTNYQITAEVATRAVVRLEGIQEIREHRGNKVHAVIESFNVLPPE